MLEIGKLYLSKKYALMLYPEQTDAEVGAACCVYGIAPNLAVYWSRELGKPVYCVEKNIPILVLSFKNKHKKTYVEVLAGDRKGWIVNEDFLKEID
jgi:hypothetical protein